MAKLTTPDDAFAAALPGISPKGLIEALEDPNVIRDIGRGDLYIQLGVLRREFKRMDIPIPQRLQYAQFLAKIGDVIKPDAAAPTAANLPQIHISLPHYPENYRPGLPSKYRQTVIEHDAQPAAVAQISAKPALGVVDE
jgi:hypothetical protein